MRKSFILATSIGAIALSSAVFAASMTDTGAIKSIDEKANSVTLADGKIFVLPAKFDVKTIKVGEKVAVTYDMKDKAMVASAVVKG